MFARRLCAGAAAFLLAAGCSRTPTQPFHAGTSISSRWFQTNGPSNAQVWDFASSGNTLVASTPSGLLRTTDLGATWTKLNDVVVFHFTRSNDDLYGAGNFPGILMSRDGGATWFDRSHGLPPAARVTVIAADGPWLWAGVDGGGIYRSGDGGLNWGPFNRGLPDGITPRAILVQGTDLLLGTDAGQFFRSSDLGFTWATTGSAILSSGVDAIIAVGSEIFVSNPDGIFVSADAGATWQVDFRAFGIHQFASQGSRLYAAGDSGVWISDRSEKSWTRAAITTPGPTGFWSLESMSGFLFLGTTAIGVMRCADLPAWTAKGPPSEPDLIGPPNATVGAVAEFGSGRLFAGAQGYGVFHTANVGVTWATSQEGLYRPTAFASVGTHRFAAFASGLARSDDDGASWTKLEGSPAPDPVAALGSNDRSLVVAAPGAGPRVYHSGDLGKTWSPATGLPTSPEVRAVTAQATHFLLALNAPAGSSSIYRSVDDGATWAPVATTGLPESPVRSMATSGVSIFAGGDAGVYVSLDDGERWRPSGLQSEKVVTITARDRRVAAITATGQLWWSTDGGATWALANQGLETVTPRSVVFASDRWYVGTQDAGVWWHVY